MTEVRDASHSEDDQPTDATLVGRGTPRTRQAVVDGVGRAQAHAPAFEETFAAEEGSDVSGLEPESTGGGDALRDEGLPEPSERTDPTGALPEDGLSESLPAAPRARDSEPHAWFLGRSFGGFRIVCAVAAGGMATVFLGRKEGPARVSKHAAIKVVHPHLAYEREFVHMFLDEARIAALIDHPNVCRVLDFGMAEDTYYLAMEYLLGETWATVRSALADHRDGARMLPAITAHVLAQACEGLHAAHEAVDDSGRALCIVHRDISPQNIFVAYDGTVRLLDFGIARAADRITSTGDGILKGRLAYMSPEQMSSATVSPAADLWSLGVVLREALEGKRLFRRASDAETMLAVTQQPLPAWRDGVPEPLRAIADRALSRTPADRQASAHALASELQEYAQHTRTQVGSSELSVWMGLLFGAEMEQKRALLQLPVPEQRAVEAPIAPPVQEEAEPSEASFPAGGPRRIPAHAEQQRAPLRPAWLNLSALVALGTVGAILGLILGRVVHREPLREPPAKATAVASSPGRSVGQVKTPSSRPVVSQLAPGTPGEPPTSAPLDEGEAARSTRNPEPTPPPEPVAAAQSPAPPPKVAGTSGLKAVARSGTELPPQSPTLVRSKQSTGTLLIAFDGGWAEISLAGKRLGTTPGRFVVPSGKHTLSVRPFGTGKAFAKPVELAPNQSLKVFLAAPKP